MVTLVNQTKKEKTKMKKEYYHCEVRCINCDYGFPYDEEMAVPKGKTFEQFSKETECPSCGCKNVLYFYGSSR